MKRTKQSKNRKSATTRKPARRSGGRTRRDSERDRKEEAPSSDRSLQSSLGPASRAIEIVRPAAAPTQSGDLEGLEDDETESSESVTELADEGQDLEAENLEAIERAPDADQGELKPRKVPDRRMQPRKFENRNRI